MLARVKPAWQRYLASQSKTRHRLSYPDLMKSYIEFGEEAAGKYKLSRILILIGNLMFKRAKDNVHDTW